MPWVAAAGAVVGGIISSEGSKSAAGDVAGASAEATAANERQYNQTRTDLAPYREAGYSALNRLQELLGTGGNTSAAGYGSLTRPFTGADLASDPGYQFTLAEGERGIQRNATAAGRNYSGATLRALQRYGQGLASTTFNDAFNRNQVSGNSLFNRLSGVSGTGQTATDQVARAGQIYADSVGNNAVGAANVSAANKINQGNIWSNVVNQGGALWQRSANQPSWQPASGGNTNWASGSGFGTGTGYGEQDYGTYFGG